MYPLTKYGLWAIRVAAAAWSVYEGFFTGGVDEKATATEMPHWHRLALQFVRTAPTGLSEDYAVCTFDLLRNDASGPLDIWTTTHFTNAESDFLTWWTSTKPLASPDVSLFQFRWYRMQFTQPNEVKPFVLSGAPVRIYQPTAVPGTGSDLSPFQVAATVTHRTPLPKHWGRVYLPLSGASILAAGSKGRISSAAMNTIAGAYDQLLVNLRSHDINECVPVTQIDKTSARALIGIRAISVDDVPDVQRRRRGKFVAARNVRDT